ncbi:ATP-binding protein [Dactylosporangium sp. NPDC051541]|uniref:sensor histidine kinase n=1 Tax=Dactylosporangium sp. NPDC051541 TaxID=3363977 RepID=UPI0037981784
MVRLTWARTQLPWWTWRLVAVPLVVWLVATAAGTGGVLYLQQRARDAAVQRFAARAVLMRDFVVSYVADLLEREQVQAQAFLTDPTVSERDFLRSVGAFGYPAAVLLDQHGRVLQIAPRQPDMLGADLTVRYAHLRTAVVDGRPAVSGAVPSAARGVPVAAFAVPFPTPSGRRVFSGAVAVASSGLSEYLSSAISLPGVLVQLVDATGGIVAANRTFDPAAPTLERADRPLAAALQSNGEGRFHRGSVWWRYTSQAIAGTPWRLSTAVSEPVLFASLAGPELAGQAAVAAAGVVGLLVVAATTRARRNRRALQLSEQRLRSMYEQSRIGMLLIDASGRVVRANPAVRRLLGRDDLVGQHLTDLLHPEDPGPPDPVAGDCGRDRDRRFRHADGRVVEVSTTCTSLHDQTGRVEHVAMQVIDVTAQRALERDREQHRVELAERAAALQRANTQVHDFMAMLSHDVRTPLTTVVTFGEVLLGDWDDVDDRDRQEYVQRMTVAGHRAAGLVTEVLTLAQLDAGALVARPIRLDVAHAVREAAAAHTSVGDERIVITAPDETIGWADPAHLQLIIGNLLGNAAKYGAPPVEVVVVNATDQIRVEVCDGGEGVPEPFVPHLFDRFTRAGSGVATTKPGTGLGLYLVARLAEAGGLQIIYAPNRPRGARFILNIPRAAAQSGSGRGAGITPRPAPVAG